MINTILWFIIALGVLVFVHELGHFLVAKKAGIRVERFSLGYPPKMFGVQVGETEYCISWIPFGGYVKVAGMADAGPEERTGAPWEFPSKPVWVRMAVIAAGPAMNFVFAFAALFVLFLAYGIDTFEGTEIAPAEGSVSATAGLRKGDRVLKVNGRPVADAHQLLGAVKATNGKGARVEVERAGQVLTVAVGASQEPLYGLDVLPPTVVGRVVPAMPAAALGLQPGDRISMVAGRPVRHWEEMSTEIRRHPDQAVAIAWERDGRAMQAEITPVARTEQGETIGQIGISPRLVSADVAPGEAAKMSAVGVYTSSWLILDFIREIIQGARGTEELGGPLRIAQLAGQTAAEGLNHFLSFLALLSVNLAVINLFPIPVLDGGHLLFLAVEGIRRRPLSLRQRDLLQRVGLAIMLFIMVLVTFNDLNQMVFHRISELF
jgi:regulator of sigma E protease